MSSHQYPRTSSQSRARLFRILLATPTRLTPTVSISESLRSVLAETPRWQIATHVRTPRDRPRTARSSLLSVLLPPPSQLPGPDPSPQEQLLRKEPWDLPAKADRPYLQVRNHQANVAKDASIQFDLPGATSRIQPQEEALPPRLKSLQPPRKPTVMTSPPPGSRPQSQRCLQPRNKPGLLPRRTLPNHRLQKNRLPPGIPHWTRGHNHQT